MKGYMDLRTFDITYDDDAEITVRDIIEVWGAAGKALAKEYHKLKWIPNSRKATMMDFFKENTKQVVEDYFSGNYIRVMTDDRGVIVDGD
jgi:hypothetical protein